MTANMHGYGKWQSDKPISDEMVRALAGVINYNKQEHKFQPAAMRLLNAADNAAYAMAAMLDLWYLATDVPVRNGAAFRDFLRKVVDNQGDPADVLWMPELGERLFPLLEFPAVYRDRPAGG